MCPDSIESLDFQPQCDVYDFGVDRCESPAAWIAVAKCCGVQELICQAHKDVAAHSYWACEKCGTNFRKASWAAEWIPLR